MDIIAKAKELGMAIANSEEMNRYSEAEDAFHQDSRAGMLMEDYKLLQVELVKATKEKRGQDIIDSIKERLLSKQQEINNYETSRKYLEAKSAVDALIKQVNDVIMYEITGQQSCASGKCGSCGGGCGKGS